MIATFALLAAIQTADVCRAFQAFPPDEAKLAKMLGAERSRKAEPVKNAQDQKQVDTKTTLVFARGDAILYQWPGGAPKLVELHIRRRLPQTPLPVQVGDRAPEKRLMDCAPEMGPSIKFHVSGDRVRLIEWFNWPD